MHAVGVWSQIREKEEDMKILEYIRAKDAREQEIAFEKERIRHEKEMETVRLRTLQVGAGEHTDRSLKGNENHEQQQQSSTPTPCMAKLMAVFVHNR